MKLNIDKEEYRYDTALEASDWRFSASIYGLIQYFRYHGLEYKIKDDRILYNSEDITEERYLDFVEYKYGEELHHKLIENIISNEEVTDAQVKIVNEKLVANTIIKKTFSKIKFNGLNKQEILDIIIKNRAILVKETFRSKKDMYANYANSNQLFNDSQDYCRLLGYCIDAGKKGKSTGFNFSTSTFVGQDEKEFDFIPFAFEGNREAFFVNDNYSIQQIKMSNETLSKKISDSLQDKHYEDESKSKNKDARKALFKAIIEASDLINRDVEVIVKDMSKDHYETLYIRKESIDILQNFDEKKMNIDYDSFCFSYKVTDKYYINIQKKVTESILNNLVLDELIELFLKVNKSYLVSQLIKINMLIRRNINMKDSLKGAYASAKKVAEKLEVNKLESYRQKLTSSIIFKDYDRVCQILLQLSNYSSIEFGFVYDLYDDFEEHKDLAYTFINALTKKSENNQ